jgi:hypothetical protein
MVELRPFLTPALDGCEWSTSCHGRNSMTEPRYALNRRLGGPRSRSLRFGKEKYLLPLPGFDPLIAQPVVQYYIPNGSRPVSLRRRQQMLILLKRYPSIPRCKFLDTNTQFPGAVSLNARTCTACTNVH